MLQQRGGVPIPRLGLPDAVEVDPALLVSVRAYLCSANRDGVFKGDERA